ncbi:MAG: hypothetical protein ABI002_10195, partial [Saprospiraceae bacterium]
DKEILQLATNWSSAFVRKRVAAAKKAKLFSSQELLQSFAIEVSKSVAADAIYIAMSFNDYGRIQEMANVNYSRLLPQTRIKEWVIRTGVAKFKQTSARTYKGADVQKLANQIAWGISVKRAQGDRRPKRRRWYNKGKTADLEALQVDLMATMGQAAIDSTIASLKQ